MAAASFAVAMYLRLGGGLFDFPAEPWLLQMAIFVVTCAIAFAITGVYRGVWRYISVRDLGNILRAVTLAVIIFMPISFLLTRLDGMPRSVPGILWFVLIAFMSGSRLLVRLLREGRFLNINRQDRMNVLVVGASDEAELFIRTVISDTQSPYHVVGVLDDKGTRTGCQIHSVSILGTMNDLKQVVTDLKAKNTPPARLILSKAAGRTAGFEQFLSAAQSLGLTLSRLPSITELHENAGIQTNVQPIMLEDLLGRAETVLDRQAITSFVQNKRVLVTGSGGTIGSELTRQIAALEPTELALVDNSEFNLYAIELELREKFPELIIHALIADVRDAPRLDHIFASFKPQVVFHAAALKHVPMAEVNVRETLLTNVMGTKNVANAAAAHHSDVMVLISTDKAVRPANVMGASKRIAEQYCQALDHDNSGTTRFLTVRFGNVLGSTGSVVPRFQAQLAKGGPLTVTHPEITRYFMTVREAVELVLQASAHATTHAGERGKIMVLDMGNPVKIADLARQMIRLAGLKPDDDIKIVYTGLRPGEKLYEELFSDSEKLSPSGADGVHLAAAAPQPFDEVNEAITGLTDQARNVATDEYVLRSGIATLVPEFTGAH
ncbi:MAG: polysaccharide biosynthesis protein [Alphaproteobacteria bacterium]|nr:polysaccharide biosynthesis protein [Alphaproteobacteria bacterium]